MVVGPGGQGGEDDQDDGGHEKGAGPGPPVGKDSEEELTDDLSRK